LVLDNKKSIKFNKKRVGNSKEENTRWVIKITILTFGISAILSFISEMLLRNVEVLVAFIILIIIIMIGIIFDIIGVAVTAADETPFHSMSSRKITGAKTSVKLIRDASKVSNICNDAIGDISGIISGAAGAVVIERIMNISSSSDKLALSIALSSITASITVGGKALGKHFAITQCNNIVYKIGYIVESIENIFKKPI
jgi:CBS domain containing-hemolysin-like protein